MNSPFELFSVVVLGSMNPAIHHPFWYKFIGVLTEPETKLASADPTLQVTPVYSQFSVGPITMTCLQQRWAAQTGDEAQFPRVVEIAKKAMDTLEHTPVTAIGINLDFCRPSGVRDLGALLATRVRSLELGFEGDGETSGAISFADRRRAGLVVATTTESVAPDPTDASRALIKYDVQLLVSPAEPSYQHFKIGDLLDEHVPTAIQQSAKHLERTLAAIRRLEN